MPGLIDGHTHPVWAGDRVHEFEMKLAGATYLEVNSITLLSIEALLLTIVPSSYENTGNVRKKVVAPKTPHRGYVSKIVDS
jgi:hypothetical protein